MLSFALYVHNSGMIDAEYKRAFKSKLQIGSQIGVSEIYLRDSISLLQAVANHVTKNVEARFPTVRPAGILGNGKVLSGQQLLYHFRARFRDEHAYSSYFDLGRSLNSDGPMFDSVFVGGECRGLLCDWTVMAEKGDDLKAFFVDLRAFQLKGLMKLVEQKRLTPKRK